MNTTAPPLELHALEKLKKKNSKNLAHPRA